MVTPNWNFRFNEKSVAVITEHQRVMAAAKGKPVCKTEALEDILAHFKETKVENQPHKFLESFFK